MRLTGDTCKPFKAHAQPRLRYMQMRRGNDQLASQPFSRSFHCLARLLGLKAPSRDRIRGKYTEEEQLRPRQLSRREQRTSSLRKSRNEMHAFTR